MCFQLGSARSVQTVHGANDGKYNNEPEPGIEVRPGSSASAANQSNADQPVIEIASSEDDTSSDEEREGSDGRRLTIRPQHPLVLRESNPGRPAADSPLRLPSLDHGEGEADRDVKWFVWGGWRS
jgi:hypothetical protein